VPSVTIAVCTRDRPTRLRELLACLRPLEYENHEILVVDNAPSTGAAREICASAGVRYVVEPVAGLCRARNRAAHESRSDIVAYLDDDAIPEPTWLAALVEPFDDPRVMAVAGQILPLGPHSGGTQPFSIDRSDRWWFERANFGGIGIGANMAFRRAIFDQWPGFDIRLGRGGDIPAAEEHNAFFSVIERGYAVAYQPTAAVRHLGSEHQTDGGMDSGELSMMAAYALLLYREHPAFRWRLVRYGLRTATGVRHAWRPRRDELRRPSLGTKIRAVVRGCSRLVRGRAAPSETR
jgi:glycosyltransferase involved in cell wall biosynthesis